MTNLNLDLNKMGLIPLTEMEMLEIDGGSLFGSIMAGLVGAIVGFCLGGPYGALVGAAAGVVLSLD